MLIMFSGIEEVWEIDGTGRAYNIRIAERKGFEPLVPIRVQRFSRPPRSTTPASFLIKLQNYIISPNVQQNIG